MPGEEDTYMKKSTTSAAMIAGLVCIVGTVHAETVLQQFALFDHPSGAIAPQAYGLRLDGLSSSGPLTFSFGDSLLNSTMMMLVVDTGSQTEIRMSGTVTGNSATGGTPLGNFNLSVTYVVSGNTTDGWEDNNANLGDVVGTITGNFGSGDQTVNLNAKDSNGDTFRFLTDGHRISGDSDTWVGRGWVLPNNTMGATNDFLFQAAVVPLPAAAWGGLAMLGGLCVARRIRK